MAQVAFWSPFHGQTGTTSNAISTAINIALNYKEKVLLTHMQYLKSSMESCFQKYDEGDLTKFDDVGIDSLERLVKAGKLSSEDFSNYTKVLVPNRLDILTGSTKLKKELFDNIYDSIIDIFDCANECYDLIFVDVNSGNRDKITEKVLEQSDIIVINLNQNEKILKSFFSKKDWLDVFDRKKLIVNLGRYDPASKCSAKYIKNNYGWKDEIYTVPYLIPFMDSCNNHEVLKFFYGNNNTQKNDYTHFFMSEVNRLSQRLLEMANIDNLNYKPVEKRSIFSSIFKFNQLNKL
ncbi:hypothetical protein [Clostridium botulinum]|uniref:hypothetical protein n=1 Tax=Clostridium botulinum TaxID=1491 RepID=UPI0007735970|nr:hypothetical protein [Clostridium botulinum]